MSKKIKVSVKDMDKLEFVISENAVAGDYFSLKEINEVDFSEIEKMIKEKRDQKINEYIQSKRKEWWNEFINGDDYKKLINRINDLEKEKISLEKDKEHIKKITEETVKNEFNSKINEMNSQKEKIEQENKSLLEQQESKERIIKLELENRFQNEKQILINQFQEEKQELQNKIDEIKRSKSTNSKVIGEEFENWIQSKYNEIFSVLEDCTLNKTTEVIGRTKPDFLFTVFDPVTKAELVKVVIEAKSENLDDTKPKTKNSSHFERLEENRKKWEAEYALLVTELEKEDEFTIKRIPSTNNKNSFMVRPEFFTIILSIIRTIYLKEKEIKQIENSLKSKQELLEEFNVMKEEILSNSIKNMSTNLDKIVGESEKIKKSANTIEQSAKIVLNTHLNTIKNKIESFNIKKIAKKLDEIEDNDKKIENNN